MTDTVGRPVVLSPSPRHMRRRRFRGDITPSQLPGHGPLVKPAPDVHPAACAPKPALKVAIVPAEPSPTPAKEQEQSSKKATLRQKRLIALAVVILVSVSIPLLVLTLMFAA